MINSVFLEKFGMPIPWISRLKSGSRVRDTQATLTSVLTQLNRRESFFRSIGGHVSAPVPFSVPTSESLNGHPFWDTDDFYFPGSSVTIWSNDVEHAHVFVEVDAP